MSFGRLSRRLLQDLWRRPAGNLSALDGMRGFASVIIVTYHCALFTGLFAPAELLHPRFGRVQLLFKGFWTGIDIFFVLSGFLIGRILISELTSDGFIHYRKFLVRRSFRIFPAYYLIITLSLLVLAPILLPVGFFRVLFGTTNWYALSRTSWSNYVYVNNYLYPVGTPNILNWGWSLCVEEHFYLVLPPLLWLVFRSRARGLRPTLLIIATLLPLFGRVVQYHRDPTIIITRGFYYYSHNRFDEILIGVVIAYFYVVHRRAFLTWTERLRWVIWPVGMACVASVWRWGGLQETGAFAVVWQFFVMALGSGLILINGVFLPNTVTKVLAHPLWYPLARVSYGTYLVHEFVIFTLLYPFSAGGSLARGISFPMFGLFSVLVFGMSSLIAAVMFVFLERPMLDRGVRLAKLWDTTRKDSALFSLPPPRRVA